MLALLLNACKSRPSQVIPAKKLEAVVLDMQLAEALASNVYPAGKAWSKEDSLRSYYAAIYNKHGVTADAFRQSITWYGRRPAELDTIYAHVIVRLAALEKQQGSATSMPMPRPVAPRMPGHRLMPPREEEP